MTKLNKGNGKRRMTTRLLLGGAVIAGVVALSQLARKEAEEAEEAALLLEQEAVEAALLAGVSNLHLVDGVELLRFDEHDGLSADGLHPSDMGYDLIAHRLIPILEKVIG